jgi:adenylyltransferase/sulfurtransferase
MVLPGFGLVAQEKLGKAKLLLVGMGGLGCPALQYLVAAGVGYIGIVDPDIITESNLHRQILFGQADIGQSKVAVAEKLVHLQNPNIQIQSHQIYLDKKNVFDLMKEYDLVLDATDNFSSKYVLNDAAAILGIPLIYGAVTRYQGQVSVFHLADEQGTSYQYRDLFPNEPVNNLGDSCESMGVIGVLPGIIGSLQAAEAIKIITGIGKPLAGRLYTHDLLETSSYEIALSKNDSLEPLTKEVFFKPLISEELDEIDIQEISVDQFLALKNKGDIFVLDVRERQEYPAIDFSDARIPLSELASKMEQLPHKEICVICHQGIRSIYAAQQIQANKKIKTYSLKGGLTAYFNKIIR